MRAGWGNLHNEVLRNWLSSPNIISLIKSRKVGQGACSVLWRVEKYMEKSTLLENVRWTSATILFNWKLGEGWEAWRRLHSKASQYSQFLQSELAITQLISMWPLFYNAKAYAFWLLRDFSDQFQDIASNLFISPILFITRFSTSITRGLTRTQV
jgi:hypothetical protein